jgi:ribonuclease BN (tRNA processing enzyme)
VRLTVIGCGTAAPAADRVGSACLVEHGRARALLDCGPGALHRMAALGVDWAGITHLLLTHFHNDHTGDVAALFFAWKHGLRPARTQPLDVIGPPGTGALLERLAAAMGDHVTDPGFAVRVVELPVGGDIDLAAGAHLSVGPVVHSPEARAYRIEAAGAVLGHTGDTGPCDALAGFLAGCDLLVAECALPDEEAWEQHLTPASVARLAQRARPRRLLLTHVYPQLDRAGLAALIRGHGWPGETLVAHDGLVLDVGWPARQGVG